jgi:hypothetical protein
MTTSLSGFLLPAVLSATVLTSACIPTSGPRYSPEAVSLTQSLKAESLSVLARSDEPFADHADAANLVVTKAIAAGAAAESVAGNDPIAEEWNLLTDPDGNLLGGAIARWEDRGTLSRTFRDEATIQVGRAFDLILCTEESKRTPGACAAVAEGGN